MVLHEAKVQWLQEQQRVNSVIGILVRQTEANYVFGKKPRNLKICTSHVIQVGRTLIGRNVNKKLKTDD